MPTISTFNGLNIALRGLLAQQRAIDVTGHNIANVETPGYSRQEAVLGAAPSLLLPSGQLQNGYGAQLGQGVDVLTYRRIRDDFLDLQWRAQNMAKGEAAVTAERLGQVEAVLGESAETGLGALLNKFWSAWADLANNPESEAARTAVEGAAQNLAGAFNALDRSLDLIGQQATQEISDLLGPNGPITEIANELAELNRHINHAIQAGQEPNDLLDRRDLLLDRLSQYGQVSVTPDATYPAMLNVTFAGAATPLVDQTTVTVPAPADLGPTPGGRLGGLLGVANSVADYRTALDALANQLITDVNAAHGSAIFTGAGAGGIAVASPLVINAGTGAAGDNSIALAIAGMRGGAIDKAWANLVTRIGGDVSSAQTKQATQERVLDALTAQRQATAGVSLDEEMVNLVRFQRGYQASARAMSTIDEMLDVLINRTGKVGL